MTRPTTSNARETVSRHPRADLGSTRPDATVRTGSRRDPGNDVAVSAVAGWEIAIKRTLGRLRFPDPDRTMLDRLGMTELLITLAHAAEVAMLPEHHRDPFDRMLIAQARADKLTLVSTDRAFAAYDVDVYW